MAYYGQHLPALSEVLPADILNSGRFSQFAPYSSGTHIKQEPYDAHLKGGSQGYYTPASPSPSDFSSYDSAPSPWSNGGRTPSLSPSPSPTYSELPRPFPTPQAPNVWISSVAGSGPAPTSSSSSAMPQYSDLVWMPANLDTPGGPQSQRNARGGVSVPRGAVVECAPAKAHGVAHLAPGQPQPQVYMGNDAASLIARVARLPENQRGKLRFFRFTQA